MRKYIDADKAKNGIMKFVNEYGEIVGMFVNDFNILLERCAVDAAEARHGRWDDLHCTVCGKVGWSDEDDYCPNCGAKMDGKEEENATD